MRKGDHDEFDRLHARAQRAALTSFVVISTASVILAGSITWGVVTLVNAFSQ